MGNKRGILCSDWLLKRARYTHHACSGLPTLIPHKQTIEVLGMKLQKVVENSQNKENVDDSGGFIVFQTH